MIAELFAEGVITTEKERTLTKTGVKSGVLVSIPIGTLTKTA